MQILMHIGKGGNFKKETWIWIVVPVTTSTVQIFLSMPLFIGYKIIFIPQSEYESPGKQCLNEYFHPDFPSVQSLPSVQFSLSVVPDSLQPHGLLHARPPCPSPTPRVHSNSCSSSRWCHPTIASSVLPFSSSLQSFPASGSFQMSQLFASCGQSIRVSASASVLPMNIQDWFPLQMTGWISLQPKGLSRIFINTTVQKHQFFGTQLSL